MSRSAGAPASSELDTPFSLYLRATHDLPLPARFYDPRTLKPFAKISLESVLQASTSPLITLFERAEGNMNADDIAAAFLLENAPRAVMPGGKKNVQALVDALKAYGLELSTRFGIESKYTTYSVAQLEADRSIWESTLSSEKDYERLLSKGIEAANAKILDFPVAALSKPQVQQSNLVFTRISWNADALDLTKIRDRDLAIQPIVDKARLTNEDASDVFSLIPVTGDSLGIPYLGYHTTLGNQYRVATNPSSASCSATSGSSAKSCAIHPDKDEYTYNIISHSDLYKGELRGSTSFLSFMIRGVFGLLDLTHSTLILNRVHHDAEQSLTDQLIEMLPFLNIDGLAHHRITARIVSPIGGSIAYHVLFFDAMLDQSDYIGFKEEDGAQLLKQTRILYLSPIPRVLDPLTDKFAFVREIQVVLSNRVAANSELITLDKGSLFELHRGVSYVEFTVSDVSDSAVLRFASAYLSRMVGHYHEVAVEKYSPFITDEFQLPISSTTIDLSSDAVYSRMSGSIRGIDLISHTYPDVFGHNFTRLCPHYPAVKEQLGTGDVEFKPQDTANSPDGASGQWLRFPPDGAIEFYFRCGVDEPQFPHPGVTISKLRNKSRYPLLPCCFRSNQFRPGQRTEVAYRAGSAQASAVSAIDITIASWGSLVFPPSFNRRLLMASEKTLFRGRLGRIPEVLMSIITSHVLPSAEDDEDASAALDDGRRIVRFGLSEPTMLHAAYLAVDPDYQKLSSGTAAERSEYLRKTVRLPHPACLYQELAPEDATPEALLVEPLFSHWSSSTHYRIIEESLDINLYVILRVAPRENVIEPNRYYFEIPTTRSGAPHMRRHSRTRPSVLLYRVRRFEGETIVDSGIELLMHGTHHTSFSGVWGTGSSSRIAELYTRSAQVLSFGTSPIDSSSYGAYVGLNTADYASLLIPQRCIPISQLIDERGLCRALTFESSERSVGRGVVDSERFSVVFPATPAYNLPFSSTLQLVSYGSTARRIFGDACLTSATRDGVFYILGDDPTRYIFVPLMAGDPSLPADIPKAPFTPLTGLSPTSVGFATQWRTAHTYLRVLLFIFSFLYTFSDDRDPQAFMESRVVIDEKRHAAHASEIYDLSGLKRVLVLREPTFAEALATVKRLAPSVLDAKGEKLVVTSRRIYDGLAYFLRTVQEQTSATPLNILRKRRWELGRVIAPPREGGGSTSLLLARSTTDMTETRGSTLNFGTARAIRTWFRGIRSGSTVGGMVVATDLQAVKDTVHSSTGVVLWRHPKTGRVWLIPGATYSLREAAVVCYLWQMRHRVAELESHSTTTAAVERLIQSGGGKIPLRQSRLTALFRQRTVVSVRRSRRSRSGRLVITGADEDENEEDNVSALKHLIDSADLTVFRYAITRDNRIELLAPQPGDEEIKPKKLHPDALRLTIEVLRTAHQRYTPMLSP